MRSEPRSLESKKAISARGGGASHACERNKRAAIAARFFIGDKVSTAASERKHIGPDGKVFGGSLKRSPGRREKGPPPISRTADACAWGRRLLPSNMHWRAAPPVRRQMNSGQRGQCRRSGYRRLPQSLPSPAVSAARAAASFLPNVGCFESASPNSGRRPCSGCGAGSRSVAPNF